MAYKDPAQQKAAMRRWYVKNKANHLAKTQAAKQAKKVELHFHLIEYFETHPCKDCGETDWIVLEFDHLPEYEKEIDISAAIHLGWAWERVLLEIAKCEVVCGNCHTRRTYRREGTWRAFTRSVPGLRVHRVN